MLNRLAQLIKDCCYQRMKSDPQSVWTPSGTRRRHRRILAGFGLGWWGAMVLAVPAQEATIQVDASRVLHPVSPYLTGACLEDVNHEIYGGLYSQMVFGESFQEPAPSPTLAGFTQYGGTWTITNGTLISSGGAGPRILGHDWHPI